MIKDIKEKLDSSDLGIVQQGIKELESWVVGNGENANLSAYGVGKRESIFVNLWERHGKNLSVNDLLAIVNILFDKNGRYHDFRDVNPFLRCLAKDLLDDTQKHLIEIYKNGSSFYDDAHLDDGDNPRRVFIDEIFPTFSIDRLIELLHWADECYPQDFTPLLGVMVGKTKTQEHADTIVGLFRRRFLRVLEGTGTLNDNEAGESFFVLQKAVKNTQIQNALKQRLVNLILEVEQANELAEEFEEILEDGSAEELAELLVSASAKQIMSAPNRLEEALIKHHGKIPASTLLQTFAACLDAHLKADSARDSHWIYRFPAASVLLRLAFDLEEESSELVCRRIAGEYSEEKTILHELFVYASRSKIPGWDKNELKKRLLYSRATSINKIAIDLLPLNEKDLLLELTEALERLRNRLTNVAVLALRDEPEPTLAAWTKRHYETLYLPVARHFVIDVPSEAEERLSTGLPESMEAFYRLKEQMYHIPSMAELISTDYILFVQEKNGKQVHFALINSKEYLK
ncbi:hypothetical protein [Leptospira noguchii]|uniref:hypothetical protein n=1 Tax=Leptospira noguchii TaxID=28182 RepID=UPI0006AC1A67|nr:hypothetical protein [Leptospira noguchii]UOG48586.1 hypothetical protein MAL00_16665 [Leptospira noguchii]